MRAGGRHLVGVVVAALMAASGASVLAHEGPPYPIVSNQAIGPYTVSLWTDPDTTDDGTPGGKFWLMLQPAAAGAPLPAATRGHLVLTPLDREGIERRGRTEPVDGDIGRQYVGLVMDHEGRFGVRVSIEGPLGAAALDADVEGTYDQRPAPAMLLLFLAPFLAVGVLWLRLLHRRSAR